MRIDWNSVAVELFVLAIMCFAALKINEYNDRKILSFRWAVVVLLLGVFFALQGIAALCFAP